MKSALVIYVLLLAFTMTAQSIESPQPRAKVAIEFDPGARIFAFIPLQYGNHALAKAHDAGTGLGLGVRVLSDRNFHLNFGYDFAKYAVTSPEVMGNFASSHYSSVYATVSYDFLQTKKFRLSPVAGFGYAVINQRTGAESFGHQDGTEFRAGFLSNYYFADNWSVFAGVHFIHNRFEVKTHPDYQNFFDEANQIQLSFGIQLD